VGTRGRARPTIPAGGHRIAEQENEKMTITITIINQKDRILVNEVQHRDHQVGVIMLVSHPLHQDLARGSLSQCL
jgi:hypothetical protein